MAHLDNEILSCMESSLFDPQVHIPQGDILLDEQFGWSICQENKGFPIHRSDVAPNILCLHAIKCLPDTNYKEAKC